MKEKSHYEYTIMKCRKNITSKKTYTFSVGVSEL